MSKLQDFLSPESATWCPGCGDFPILKGLKDAYVALGIEPHETMIVSGIGCGSKVPYYIRTHGYNALHGRALPVAQGIKLANHKLKVVVITGDGDGYGIGGNHFTHAMRRNTDLTHIVQNNQIYGLTKGQYSPTSDPGFITTTSPDGAIETAVNPLTLSLASGATFIARTSSGDVKHLTETIRLAIAHKGYSLIDILQPCVTYNKVNTYQWYRQRVYKINEAPDYSPSDIYWAFKKCLEWGEKIPIGILYQVSRPTYEDQVRQLKEDKPLIDEVLGDDVRADADQILAEFT